MRRPPRLAPALLAGLAALAPLARAQDSPPPLAVTERDLSSGEPWGASAGRPVVLEGVKFLGVFGERVDVGDVPRGKLLVDPAATDLAARLAAWHAAGGKLDPRGRSNVRIEGTARDQGGARVVLVSSVVLLADDVARFTERARAKEHDPDALLALAREASLRAERWDEPELRAWSRATTERALDERGRTLARGDFAARIELARAYGSVAHVTSHAIALLDAVEADAEAPEAERARARSLLEKDLDAVRCRGRWVARDDQRRELGFVRAKDAAGQERWVRREQAELEAVVAERRPARVPGTVVRTFLSGRFEQAVRDGVLVVGMNKTEVAQARGAGWPVSVERATAVCGRETVVWDRWDLADGRALYFEQGELILWKAR